MQNETGTRRNMLKGYMFETVVKQFLENNGFSLINCFDNKRIRKQREHFIELRGRGTWHQIDCPCDYTTFIPFIYPIRLLGEVKFYAKPISKEHIREFIGVIKDLQENYFMPDSYNEPFRRFTEVGVFFSANGFDEEADKLAFVHNIKNISYKNNYLIEPIKKCIEELERNYFSARQCISQDNTSEFISSFQQILENNFDILKFKRRFDPADGFERLIFILRRLINRINTSFIATTSGGSFIHFVGRPSFPSDLFLESDEQSTVVFIKRTTFGDAFFLMFENDPSERKFYFTPPASLQQAVYYGTKGDILNQKEEYFKTLHATLKINGITRNLIFRLSTDWLEAQRYEGA